MLISDRPRRSLLCLRACASFVLTLASAACEPEQASPSADATSPAQESDAGPESPDSGSSADRDAHVPDAANADSSVIPHDAGSAPALDAGAIPADSAVTPSDADASVASDAAADALVVDATGDGMANEAAVADQDAALIPDAGPSSKQLAVGRAHGCSLDPDISGLLCWGDNRAGQSKVPTLDTPRFVAAGGDVTCAIDKSGNVTCWGDNSQQQLAVPALLGHATQVAVGEGHVCALTAAGKVRCWGDDSAGQLTPPAMENVQAIGAGAKHSCALAADGVHCWGDNALGQREVPQLANVSQLAVGGFHNCVIAGSAIQCWGGSVPALLHDIPQVTGPTVIAAGRSHSCVIDRVGARCWGDASARSLAPRELTWPRQIAVGGSDQLAFACARHLQGVTCWGDNSLHQTEYNGYPDHVLYRSEAEIAAPASVVWGVLMDLGNYSLWNPYTIAMQSTLKIGDPMIMTVKMSDLITLTQTENIRVLDAGHKACWGIDTDTPELNSGERCQWLEPLPGGGTRYVSEDLIEGSLNLVVLGLFDSDLKSGFDRVARGLKTRAEALNKP
jgi:hypothetical protein